MPCVGLSPFLHRKWDNDWNHYDRCQCPRSDFLHFYCHHLETKRLGLLCVNALSRAYPISTLLRFCDEGEEGGVNALYRAYSISTNRGNLWKSGAWNCVNALYRAYSISTVSLKNLVKSMFFGPVLGGNCQTILIFRLFRTKLCIFTICSYLTRFYSTTNALKLQEKIFLCMCQVIVGTFSFLFDV